MFLKEIISRIEERVEMAARSVPPSEIVRRAAASSLPRDFLAALLERPFGIIAEIKRASPSKGNIVSDLNPLTLAQKYERGGAAAISILTEPFYFKGNLDDLARVRQAVALPLLRKDFCLCPYQIYEARAYGADAVLLIAAILSEAVLKKLIKLCTELGMVPLVEVHDGEELKRALKCGAPLIGINNRNLNTLTVDKNTVYRLKPLVPDEVPVVAESGLSSPEDMAKLKRAGVKAALIGEALVKDSDPEAKLKELLYGQNKDLWADQP